MLFMRSHRQIRLKHVCDYDVSSEQKNRQLFILFLLFVRYSFIAQWIRTPRVKRVCEIKSEKVDNVIFFHLNITKLDKNAITMKLIFTVIKKEFSYVVCVHNITFCRVNVRVRVKCFFAILIKTIFCAMACLDYIRISLH